MFVVSIESKVPHCVLLDQRLSEGRESGRQKHCSAFYTLLFAGQTAFSFLHSPVAACDVKQSVFCSTKDICL